MQSSTPLARQRVVAQGIAVPRSVPAAEIVTRLGAVQAQDYPGALWSIALRMTGATRADIERAHLLPGFDALLLGYKDRSATLAAEHASRISAWSGMGDISARRCR